MLLREVTFTVDVGEHSLLADAPVLCLATVGQGDFWDAWSEEEPPLEAPPPAEGDGFGWACTATQMTPNLASATTANGT
ncbi:hypothetical protein [Streptomyces sp. NPDC007206]|uniref:hypothetical protein n=1 Tax=Streptomyces sp. NPDC007206 TaxID=3154317 RepID=UPI0033F55B57